MNADGGGLSLRGGALVLKSVSLFLASTSRSNAPSAATTSAKKSKNKNKNKSAKMQQEAKKNKITPKVVEQIRKDTHFSKLEIEQLYRIYRQLQSTDRNNKSDDKSFAVQGGGTTASVMRKTFHEDGINRTVFCDLMHNTFDLLAEDILMERIFVSWGNANSGILTFPAFMRGLSVFLKGTLAERIDFCFAVYDMNSDGFISKEEMFILLKNCLIKHSQPEEDPDEGVKDLVEIVLKKVDVDGDGKVSREDFKETVTVQPLLLQAFGPCLPSMSAAGTFLATLSL